MEVPNVPSVSATLAMNPLSLSPLLVSVCNESCCLNLLILDLESDFCKLYGWSNDLRVKGCVNGVNQRTITCQAGFYAQSSVPGTNATQASGAKDSITLIGDAPFVGCKGLY